MKIDFVYDEDKDIDCLLSKGGSSMNSLKPTKTYEALLAYTKDLSDREKVRGFVRSFRSKDINANILQLQENWTTISAEYEKRAENVFGVKISDTIIAYLTITGRHPYSVEGKYFYAPANKINANKTCMHELWHFYTWHKFGQQQNIIGPAKYNEIKEALTVLLNLECADLMAGEIDNGYHQHQGLRAKMSEVWNNTKDIDTVWNECVNVVTLSNDKQG